MSSVKMKADEKTKESGHDPVVFEEELPIILNNPGIAQYLQNSQVN